MGQVAVTVKVYPESPDKLEDVKTAVGKIVDVKKLAEEPIGFGLVLFFYYCFLLFLFPYEQEINIGSKASHKEQPCEICDCRLVL